MQATTASRARPAPDATFRANRSDERSELAALVDMAAHSVAPLWPLDSAIAVNPLSGFEDLPFEQALAEASGVFGARGSLSLPQWRKLMAEGRINKVSLDRAAVAVLGGLDEAFALLGPDLNAFNLLLARLTTLPADDTPPSRQPLSPGMAVLARWLAVFFDRKAALPLRGRERGLYACLVDCLRHDPALLRLAGADGAALFRAAPADPLDVLADVLRRQGVGRDERFVFLRGLVAALPGWAGHLRWRIEHGGMAASAKAPATMTDLMALVALVTTAIPAPAVARNDSPAPCQVQIALLAHFGLPADAPASWAPEARARLERVAALDDVALGLVFQQAAEASYLATFAPQLELGSRRPAWVPERPAAQLVFCIDVRSEPMRRAVEAQGAFETFGYAGFFGLPIAIDPACEARPRNQLPVLLSPAHTVREAPVPGREAEAGAVLARHACVDNAQRMLDTTRGGATGFAVAEATGPLAALAMLARTLAPQLAGRLQRALVGERAQVLAPMACNDSDPAMSLEAKVGYAAGLFRLTALPAQAARLVVLVGHAGCTTNNAYAASLDCGACGGHPGGPNARLMAAILNDPMVRDGLRDQGLPLPADTWFVAAQHDTTRDMVTVFDRQLVPASHAEDLARLERALDQAGDRARKKRAEVLGRTPKDLIEGAAHWGEVRPEWGLSGNAAFIIAPRAMTSGMDLAGTAFLHSYDWRHDADGSALAAIMTAPMIVAQWINCQYLFSTIDNERFGAGDKTTQNVLGGFGVVQGNGGDLCTGLPRQSVFRDDGVPFHTPRRLSVIVSAPPQRVQDVVLAHDAVGRLVDNGWINLVVIDPWKHTAHHWVRGGWVVRPC